MAKPLPSIFTDVNIAGASKSISASDQTYIEAVFENYLGNGSVLLEGICIEHDDLRKTIKVELDRPKKPGVNVLMSFKQIAEWGRPKLARSEVIGKHVRLFKQITFINDPLNPTRQDRIEAIALHSISPKQSNV